MSHISLRKITFENWREALKLSVTPEQQQYVAAVTPPVAIALAKAYVRPGGKMVEPYAIYHFNQMVGSRRPEPGMEKPLKRSEKV
ncbi:hypothetical protein ACFO4N_15940 [Camelliibacillus cellulosilyticus]|uniref:Uncharacterized protein n=1 Tax=Camelliibacillus cellulosilyticus TaxID=2174486 RepID=A0ABV9GQD4_9BACL